MSKSVIFVGWIYGDKEDETILRGLGVRGEMRWRRSSSPSKSGIFSHYEIDMEIAAKLKKGYPAFWPGSFTAIDVDGN